MATPSFIVKKRYSIKDAKAATSTLPGSRAPSHAAQLRAAHQDFLVKTAAGPLSNTRTHVWPLTLPHSLKTLQLTGKGDC